MGEIGRVQRVEPAVNDPHLLGHVTPGGDQKHRRQQRDEPQQEDALELHNEEEAPTPPAIAHREEPPHSNLDIAV